MMASRIRYGIKTRFVMLAVLLVAITSSLWGWWSWHNERKMLYDGLEGEGRQMVESLASPIINALLYEEMGVIEEGGLLDNFIEEIMNNTGFPVVYAYVTDQSGKVLAHNNYAEYGKVYEDPLTAAALDTGIYSGRLLSDKGKCSRMLDLAMPLRIHGKSWGALRVGISTAPLELEMNAMANRIILVSLLFFVLGVFLSWLIGRSMAKPIEELSTLMSSVSPDNLGVQLPPGRSDEIGLLQNSFGAMLERLRNSEMERQKAVTRLIHSEKLASIGKIVAGVAHEVNNPLATISTCLHNLEQVGGESNRNLEMIRQGSERIERIVRQLTEFSRAASLEIGAQRSDLFFAESAEFARMALRKRELRFIAEDCCHEALTLCMDKGKIQQVILNLLMNGADASPTDGRLFLRAFCRDGGYTLEVTDEGSGVPPDLHETIFEIFYTTKPAGKGTGIGLAICRSIVEMHGGTMSFESSPGKTVFSVTIPLRPKGENDCGCC